MLSSTRTTAGKSSSRQTSGLWVEPYLGPALLRLVGAALLLASAGLWIAPGGAPQQELALMKMGASLFFACLGLVFIYAGQAGGTDEFHIDESKREIRHVLRGQDGIARLKARYRFNDLSDVRLDDGMLLARDRAGRVVLNRPVGDLDVPHAIAVATRNGLIQRM
jgi:hypothetical protein